MNNSTGKTSSTPWLDNLAIAAEEQWLNLYKKFLDELGELTAFRIDYKFMADTTLESGHSILAKLKEKAPLFAKPQEEFIEELEGGIKKHSQLIVRLSVVYLVSILEACLRDTVHLLLLVNKEFLEKSSKKLAVKEILEFGDMNELVKSLIEDEVYGFSRRSFKQQMQFLQETFDIDIGASGVNMESIDELIETRNIIIHNKGFIDQTYLDRIKGSSFKVGDLRPIGENYLESSIEAVNTIVQHINNKGFGTHLKSLLPTKTK